MNIEDFPILKVQVQHGYNRECIKSQAQGRKSAQAPVEEMYCRKSYGSI